MKKDFLSFTLVHINLIQVLLLQICLLPYMWSLGNHLTIQTQIPALRSVSMVDMKIVKHVPIYQNANTNIKNSHKTLGPKKHILNPLLPGSKDTTLGPCQPKSWHQLSSFL